MGLLISAALLPALAIAFSSPLNPCPSKWSAASSSPLFRGSSSIGGKSGPRYNDCRQRPLLRVATLDTDVTSSGESASTYDKSEKSEQLNDSKSDDGPSDNFDWYKSWYPIVPVEYLDPEKPSAFKLLNTDLVIYNDGAVIEDGATRFGSKKDRPKGATRSEGTWRAFADACPHRKAPLSEGRVEDDGTLQCSYHAWRWDGEGELAAVPQAQSTDELDRIKSNPKSNCNSFPTKVKNGVLWVWASSGSDARIESELTPIPMMDLPHEVEEDLDESRVATGPWNFRELPYGHDYFIENVVDPAHVPSSHHNVVGSRYTDTKPMKITTVEGVTKNGFKIAVDMGIGGEGDIPAESTTTFVAPCLVEIKTAVGDNGARQILELYSSPSRPGFCNHVGRQVVVKNTKGETPGMLKLFLLPMPKWLNHILAGTFLNQDALFLHAQERTLHSNGDYSTNKHQDDESLGDDYTKAVLPMSADKGVINFRNWLRVRAGGRIPYRGNPVMPPVDNEVVFDIYNSHTKHCHTCSTALKNLRKFRFSSYVAAAAMGVWRPSRLGGAGTGGIVALFGGFGLIANKLISLLHRMEYSHAEND